MRLKAINEKYNSIAEQTGIKAQPEKMRSIGASSGSKVVKNYSKALENSGRSGIMKESSKGATQQSPINNRTSVSQNNNGVGSALWPDEKRTNMFRTEKYLLEIGTRPLLYIILTAVLLLRKKGIQIPSPLVSKNLIK